MISPDSGNAKTRLFMLKSFIFANFESMLRRFTLIFLLISLISAFTDASNFGLTRRKYKETYANGQPKVTGHISRNEKTGRWTFYDESGKVTRREQWKKGNLMWQAEYENGKLRKLIGKDGKVTTKPGCGC